MDYKLTLYGYEVRVQETDARRPELGRTARVAEHHRRDCREAAARRSGSCPHYDSVTRRAGRGRRWAGRGGGAGSGAGARGAPDRTVVVFVLVTDGEEAGLMGAAALVTDRDVNRLLQAYINIESDRIRRPGDAVRDGPAERLARRRRGREQRRTRAAARSGSRSTGACRTTPTSRSSVAPDIPGLNFAPVGDSYAYHTARDIARTAFVADHPRHRRERRRGSHGARTRGRHQREQPRRATFFDIGGDRRRELLSR